MNIVRRIFNWFLGYSFYGTKKYVFFILAGILMFDMFAKFDFEKWTLEVGSATTSIPLFVALSIVCVTLIGYDFWLEKIKSKARNEHNRKILKTIRKSGLSEPLKKALIDSLK